MYSLGDIFKYLDVKERLISERVCKKWNEALKSSIYLMNFLEISEHNTFLFQKNLRFASFLEKFGVHLKIIIPLQLAFKISTEVKRLIKKSQFLEVITLNLLSELITHLGNMRNSPLI